MWHTYTHVHIHTLNLLHRPAETNKGALHVARTHTHTCTLSIYILHRLAETNKGALHVDPVYSTVHYSHPPLVQRLSAIAPNAVDKKSL
jgi:Zn-dependent protease with chaperone function